MKLTKVLYAAAALALAQATPLAVTAASAQMNADLNFRPSCEGKTGRAFEFCIDNLPATTETRGRILGVAAVSRSSACDGLTGRPFDLCTDNPQAFANNRISSVAGANRYDTGKTCDGLTGRAFELCVDDLPALGTARGIGR